MILQALDACLDELAEKAYEPFVAAMPDARSWTVDQQELFTAQARGRLGAVLAVIDHGRHVDEALQVDLELVGSNAASVGASLPHLLLVLRISRDLLLAKAVAVTEDDRELIDFAQRLLPAVDRLTDAIARGFWRAQLAQREQCSMLMEDLSYGVYETDMDGVIVYANPALSKVLGTSIELHGLQLSDVIRPEGTNINVSSLFAENHGGRPVLLSIGVPSGTIDVTINTVVRRDDDGCVIGFAGFVHPVD